MPIDVCFPLKVVDVFASVLPPTSSFLLTQLQKFHSAQPRNPVLVARCVGVALLLKNFDAHVFFFYLLPSLVLSLPLPPLRSHPPSPFSLFLLSLRLVQCALAQTPIREDLAQTALATYLANNIHCDFLWRM